jgi:hypothetical protein
MIINSPTCLYGDQIVKVKRSGQKNTRVILPNGTESTIPNELLQPIPVDSSGTNLVPDLVSKEQSPSKEEIKSEEIITSPQIFTTCEVDIPSKEAEESLSKEELPILAEMEQKESKDEEKESLSDPELPSVIEENKQPPMISRRLSHLIYLQDVEQPVKTARVRPR